MGDREVAADCATRAGDEHHFAFAASVPESGEGVDEEVAFLVRHAREMWL